MHDHPAYPRVDGSPSGELQIAVGRCLATADMHPDTAVVGCLVVSQVIDPHAGETGIGYTPPQGIPVQRQREMLIEALRHLPDDDVR